MSMKRSAPSAEPPRPRQRQKACDPSWLRPAPPALDPATDPFVMQQFEIDYTVLSDGVPNAPAPVIRMYGVTPTGNSVLVNVLGFTPYFYVEAPPGFTVDHCKRFRDRLNEEVAKVARGPAMHRNQKPYVLGVEVEMAQSLMGFHGDTLSPFIKVWMSLPKQVPCARDLLEAGALDGRCLRTYEADTLFVLRFMVDTHIVGCSWIKLAAGGYEIARNKVSTCQIELNVDYSKLESLGVEGEWSKIGPARILSFDIECAARKGLFPDAQQDPVIMIANMVTVQGESKPQVKNVFVLKTCSNIVGSDVLTFDNERDLLREWKDFVVAVDPDVIIGYNIVNFDFPYLLDRAKALKVTDFSSMSRITNSAVNMRDSKFSSKAYGTRESKEIVIDGRVPFDILQVAQREYKLRSYSLNFVSAHFLGEQKEEVVHTEITKLFEGSDDDRRRLAVYCLKDSYLPQRLMDKLMIFINYAEMSRVTGIPFSYLLKHGQQIRVQSQLYRKAMEHRLRVPYVKHESHDDSVKYTGAVVIEPTKGFHELPVATLDFASLYPSIMISHNICYSTLVQRGTAPKLGLKDEDVEVTPNGDTFVKAGVRQGLLPLILQDLLGARKRAKQLLAKETDPLKKAVYDGRQLALKISANSVYGFTGATNGKLPCQELAASLVEAKYSKAQGFEHDSKVIYGDTDSVMVIFHETDMAKVMQLGREAAAMVTTQFPKPVSLEFEKVYYPYLLISKKRYAGLLWTDPAKPTKIDTKGIETVRRDNCPLVKHVITTCLDKILLERNLDAAINFVKSVISDLLQNKLDLSLVVISKALSKESKEYAGKQAHVELARRMHERDSASAPGIGDRVPYVIIASTKGAKAYEKAEDPLYVLENNLPLDYQYYLDQQLRKPVTRIFKSIMKDVNTLFSGEHTRTITIATPKQEVGGIVAFAKRTLRCHGCRGPLPPNEQILCEYCRKQGKEAELFFKQTRTVAALEKKFCRVWTQCQQCMESLHQPVICQNRDCPIFYMRTKVRKDLQEATEVLQRYNPPCTDPCINDW
eukprot:m51a1_g9485 dna polymerase delta catalytic subunit, putative (1039) ;mRNA; r:626019-630517